jgi:hypothetical protein
MQKIWFIILLMSVFAYAQEGSTDNMQTFGEGITLTDTTLISVLLANPDAYVGKKVVVKGMAVDVCKKRGCWVKLASDKEFEDITIKVNDGEIVFPYSGKGKDVVAEGVFEAIELSEEKAKKYYAHKAEEQGKAFDESTITGPVKIYRIKGTGALVEK